MFDLNRSTPVVKEKYVKVNSQTRMASNRQTYDPNVYDLADTISSSRPNQLDPKNLMPRDIARTQGALPRNKPINQGAHFVDKSAQQQGHSVDAIRDMPCEDVGPEVIQLVQHSVNDLQRGIENAIGDRISRELNKITNAMSQMTEAMRLMAPNCNMNAQSNTARTDVGGNATTAPSSFERFMQENISQAAPPTENQWHHDFRGFRVERFGLKFDGNQAKLSVEDFVFRLEHLQAQYGIPWTEILRDFHLLVSDAALDWFWLQVNTRNGNNWPALKHALLLQYKTPRSNFEIMRDLVERRQQPGESLDSYFRALNQIRSKLEQPIPEYEFIKIAKRNLKESVARLVYAMDVTSIEQLRISCIEAERCFPKRDMRPLTQPQRMQRHVSEVYPEKDPYEENTTEEVEVSAVNNLICWNCREPGHTFMECMSSERYIFCYKCGRPDTITPKCPNCKSENPRMNVGKAGNHRSKENPAK